jgi:hypothetical protein
MTVAGFPLISGVRVITWSVVTVDASCCFSKTRKPLARMLRLNNPAPAHTPAEAMNERRDGSLATWILYFCSESPSTSNWAEEVWRFSGQMSTDENVGLTYFYQSAFSTGMFCLQERGAAKKCAQKD